MYPGSFIWSRLNDEWLVSRRASAYFAASTVVIAAMSTVWFVKIPIQDSGPLSRCFWAIVGVLAAVSIFFLWGGMWRYWMRHDSSKISERVWFVLLVFGAWYGAVLYYLLVYLPTRRERSDDPSL